MIWRQCNCVDLLLVHVIVAGEIKNIADYVSPVKRVGECSTRYN